MKLQMSLTAKWFEMTDPNGKTEDYREITSYWAKRFLDVFDEMEFDVWQEMIDDLADKNRRYESVDECIAFFWC